MDSMELERERGITIKAKAVRMKYKDPEGQPVHAELHRHARPRGLHLRGEPGLAACEGAILVVDATQGVQAQTLANAMLAQEVGLKMIPVINKIDLPSADVDGVTEQIFDVLKILEDPVLVSAKSGSACTRSCAPSSRACPRRPAIRSRPLSALIFDSTYSTFRGVVLLVRVVDGVMKKGLKVRFFSTGTEAVVRRSASCGPKQPAASSPPARRATSSAGSRTSTRSASATRSWKPRGL